MPASVAERAMVPMGIGDGFLGASSFDAVAGSVSDVVDGGRQMMHPINDFSRTSR